MKERGVHFIQRRRGVLKGWILKFNKTAARPGEGYANIVKCRDGVVEGIVYEIEESDLSKLDVYEGYPKHYTRIEVEVEVKGKKLKAVTYVANPNKVKDGLKPSKHYLKRLLKGCNLLSKEYCEMLRNIETLD